MKRFFRSAAFPILIVLVLAFFAQRLISPDQEAAKPTYTEFLTQVEEEPRTIEEVTIKTSEHKIDVVEADGEEYSTGFPANTEEALVNSLRRREVSTIVEGSGGGGILTLLTYALPFLLFFAFWIFLMNQMQGGGSKVMSFGKSRAKRMSVDAPKITFRDVAGADEAVQELHEIKEFLENPKKFQALGARIPKGVLLYGPPGTGKTLLARAVAGEAGVPFFSISGSDFVEMFVGVGASRVRDLFEQAKQNSPCIIFMDEIDAVGRHRGAGMGGGHDEREQTLNQLLVEMDGFEMKDNIILIAATNRPDILDPALLRPGRFDRQIVADRPDRKGRKKILEVHTRGKPLAKEIELDTLAGQTPGFTGADLANLINEAALLTARSGKREIGMKELEEGIMRVIAGPEKKSRVMSEKERRITAYHELGHAIVGHVLPNCDPVHKISVISRGQALGYTISLPTEDKFLTSRAELSDTMAMTLGGRAAEEIVFGEITTGASNDLEKVTETAKQMVMRYGMSERLGPRVFGHDRTQPFLGREFSSEPDYSDEIAREIDDEIRRIVEEAHQTAKDILSEHRVQMDDISKTLLERETIESTEFEKLLDGVPEEEIFGPPQEEPSAKPEPEPEPDKPGVEGPRPVPRARHDPTRKTSPRRAPTGVSFPQMGRRERIRATSGLTFSAVAIALLAASAPAAAAPKRITGKLDARGYTVIALAAGGKATTNEARRGRFNLRPPARVATLHLRAKDGTYAGPIVARTERKGKRGGKRSLAGKRARRRPVIVGIKAGARLGKVDVRKLQGFAKVSEALSKRSVDEERVARARKGRPIGAGNFGRVLSKRTRGGAPADRDLDGIPDPLDIDDDGDLILDPLDPSPSGLTALASAPATPNDFEVHPILPLLWEDSASSNAGSSDAEIEDALPTLGRMGIDPVAPGAELDCGGASDPNDPAGWSGGLSYCARGGSGSSYEGDNVFGGPPFPGPPGGTYDADGDGFGTLDARSPWQLHHGAMPRDPDLAPAVSQIGSGDVLIQRVTSGGPEGECGSANTSCFTSTVPFVFATAQALASWGDKPGENTPVSYPIGPSPDPLPVSDDPADADTDVEVTVTSWRPQRRPASEDECASPQPGCTNSEWIDMGGLKYTATVLDPPGGASTTNGGPCPSGAYTIPAGEDELVPSFSEEDQFAGGLVDQAQDRPANALNTFTYELNLTQCLNGATWNSGEDIGVGFIATTNAPGSTGFTEQSGVRFRLE